MSERNKPFAWLYDQDVLEHARNAYAMRWWNITDNYEEGVERFNTMLAQQRAEAKVEALREAARSGQFIGPIADQLEHRAKQIGADDDCG